MKTWTYQEIKQKIEADLDLSEEDFITPDELVGYCNEAIHEAESEILKINEDYFLASATLTLINGTSAYSLPAGIYAQKIRGLQYANGALVYPIKRVRGGAKFDTISMIQNFGQADDYMYFLTNTSATTGPKVNLVPPARESGGYVTIWYIRSANRVTTAAEQTPVIDPTDPNSAIQLATVIDIPEFITFVIDFMKAKCLSKDGDARYPEQLQALENQRKMMVDSLTQQVPDDDDMVMPDMSFYNQSS